MRVQQLIGHSNAGRRSFTSHARRDLTDEELFRRLPVTGEWSRLYPCALNNIITLRAISPRPLSDVVSNDSGALGNGEFFYYFA